VVEEGGAKEVIARPQHDRTKAFLSRILAEQHEAADPDHT